jgi:chromosome segregation ATPase
MVSDYEPSHEGQLEQMHDLYAALEAENRALHSQLEAKDTELGKQDAEIIVLRSQVEAAEFYAQAVKKMYEQSYDDLAAAQARITALSRQNEELTARAGQLEADLKHAKLYSTTDAVLAKCERITQLEGALKALVTDRHLRANIEAAKAVGQTVLVLRMDIAELEQAQHALTPLDSTKD